MKRTLPLLWVFLVCITLSGCSIIEGAINKLPFLEDVDLSGITDKAEKAWDEVGKDALNDAVDDAKDAIINGNKLAWPENTIMKDIPQTQDGYIDEITEKDTFCEILVKDFSSSSYDEYISLLNESIGPPHSDGLYKHDNRLIYVQYDKNSSELTISVSLIKTSPSASEEAS